LLDLPQGLLRLEPHPYQTLGAPYGPGASPFRLRRGVIDRLAVADARLAEQRPGWRLAIFDAWRPVAVQDFMVSHAIGEECRGGVWTPSRAGAEREDVVREVGRFWAPPSLDPATPPPHSTGAAVDLTLADADGPLEMGGAIDTVGPVSEPDHHRARAEADALSPEAIWHGRRQRLAAVMGWAGFAQHPNEWWHFSWGDQLWAWRRGERQARYGRVVEVD
jgi:D-alanyl-D-alanine dipeptidase